MRIVAKAGDTAPMQTVRLSGRDGPIDLTGATVLMQVRGSAPVPCDIVDAATGVVRPTRDGLPVPTGPARQVVVDIEWEITYADSQIQTVPEVGYDTLVVWDDLDPPPP